MLKFKGIALILFLNLGLFCSHSNAQIYDPVDWSFEVKSIDENKAELIFTAKIEKGWHVYATKLPSDMGPIPTSINLEKSAKFEKVGAVKEGKYKTEYDPNFDMDLNFFSDKAVFRQTILRKSTEDFKVGGFLTFMVCNDEMCLPPEDVEFSLNVSGAEEPKSSNQNPSTSAFAGMNSQNEPAIFDPVEWSFTVENETDSSATLVAEARIDEGWHLYGNKLESNVGPVATSFNFEKSESYSLSGDLKAADKPKVSYDPNFEMNLSYFEDKARFVQEVKKFSKDSIAINGMVTFMVCDDMRCLPPENIEFTYELGPGISNSVETSKEELKTSGKEEPDQSNWGILVLSFLGGFAALLTPCVFPMVPMTVSFFTKQSKTKALGVRNALFYSFSIIAVYVLLSLPFHLFESVSPDILNEVSTNAPLNIIFFLIFIIFAISFFGAFEITLPTSWINKADKASDVGGFLGIFFMAIVLVLVSFSCTGPLLGALLGSVLSTDGGATALTVGMIGFGFGLALPFGLFAGFPSWLNSLPKSGGWLNTVKVVLGFLELALAFKFLSNADLVLQAGLLPREIFLAIWIAVFLALSLYLFGLFRMPHDSKSDTLSVGRMLLAVFSISFTLYLIPGLWGAPLKLISGFPPPAFYSEAPGGFGAVASSGGGTKEDIPQGADPEHCPHNLNCFHDFETGLEYAKEVNKPILLDFTGWACVNCRKMEEQVWSDPRVLSILRNEVVLISLYVDERKNLPEDEQYVSEATGKKIRTVGNKWSDFQITHFKNNSQPYYVMLNHESLEPLHESAAYDPDVEAFINWLRKGIEEFEAS